MNDLQRQNCYFRVCFHLDLGNIDLFSSDFLLPLFAWGGSRLPGLQLPLSAAPKKLSTCGFVVAWGAAQSNKNKNISISDAKSHQKFLNTELKSPVLAEQSGLQKKWSAQTNTSINPASPHIECMHVLCEQRLKHNLTVLCAWSLKLPILWCPYNDSSVLAMNLKLLIFVCFSFFSFPFLFHLSFSAVRYFCSQEEKVCYGAFSSAFV